MIEESLIKKGLVFSIPRERARYGLIRDREYTDEELPSEVLNPIAAIYSVLNDGYAVCDFYDKNVFGFSFTVPISLIKEQGTVVNLDENDKENIERLLKYVECNEYMSPDKFASGFSDDTKRRIGSIFNADFRKKYNLKIEGDKSMIKKEDIMVGTELHFEETVKSEGQNLFRHTILIDGYDISIIDHHEEPVVFVIDSIFIDSIYIETKEEVLDYVVRKVHFRILTDDFLKAKVYLHKEEKLLDGGTESFGEITKKMLDTYTKKNHDYGNAFSEMYDELGFDYGYGKIREKVNRIKTLKDGDAMVENEPLEDALLDCANYCILTLMEYQKRKGHGKE